MIGPKKSIFSTLAWGVVAGAVLASGIGIRMSADLSSAATNPIAATWMAALIGAALGGFISYMVARQSSVETLRRDAEARRSAEHSSSLKAMVTAMQISNRLYTMNIELEAAFKSAGPDAAWTALRPSAGPGTSAPDFEPVDFIPFINNNKSEIVSDALMMSDRTHALQAASDAYRLKRDEFEAFAAPFTSPIGGPGIAMGTSFPPAEAAIAKVKVAIMNDLATQMLSYSREYLKDARSLVDAMNDSHQEYFKGLTSFKVTLDPDLPLD